MKHPQQTKNVASDADSDPANAAVTKRLKAYYDDLTHQDIPDRFLDLLAQLETAEKKLVK